jgi:hypothetical protein
MQDAERLPVIMDLKDRVIEAGKKYALGFWGTPVARQILGQKPA